VLVVEEAAGLLRVLEIRELRLVLTRFLRVAAARGQVLAAVQEGRALR
jgi:hypothetical protein